VLLKPATIPRFKSPLPPAVFIIRDRPPLLHHLMTSITEHRHFEPSLLPMVRNVLTNCTSVISQCLRLVLFSRPNASHLLKYTANLTPLASPTVGRNVSAPIFLAHMPHLPPRSPRRERREHDNTSSPTASDNEDESYQPGSRRKGTTSGPITIPARFASQTQGSDDQDSQVMSVSKVSMKQANAYEQQVASGENEYRRLPRRLW
jgi:hypothetical protein